MSSRKVSSASLRAERAGLNSAKRVSSSGTGRPGRKQNGRLLFALPVLLVPQLIGALTSGRWLELLVAMAGMVVLYLGAIAVREGLARERADKNSIRGLVNRTPLKAVGSALFGGGFAAVVAATYQSGSIAMGVLFGLIAGGACVLRYGLDPKPDHNRSAELAETHGVNLKTVVRDLDEAEARISNIREAIDRLPGSETKRRVTRVADLAAQVLETIEQDPRDIRNARRFMISYLPRAEEIVITFADDSTLLQQPAMAERFSSVINELTDVFSEQQSKLTNDESLDLEVKLEVLSQRLRSEGAG